MGRSKRRRERRKNKGEGRGGLGIKDEAKGGWREGGGDKGAR